VTKDTASSRALTAQMRQNTYGLKYGHPPNKGLIMAKKSTHHLQYADFAFAASATPQELETLCRLTTRIDVKKGSILMHQGAFGNEVLLLVHGQLVIEKDGKLIASIAPGAVVGERAVILNEPRDATVRAAFDSTILAMSRSEFNTLLAECPSIARNILEEALTRA
tara:strand:+ start:366 stop:863 length:498 start_codon:yes stop_codon:yes gene_type:complete